MKSEKITIKIDKDTPLTEAVCQALDTKQKVCTFSKVYQTIKPSLGQDIYDWKEGENMRGIKEWNMQIGIMLG